MYRIGYINSNHLSGEKLKNILVMQKVMHTFLKSQQNSRISAFYSLAVNQDVVGSSPTVGARMRADDKSHLLFCCFSDIYSLTVNQDGVGERSESGVKAGKRNLYSVQVSRRGRLRRVQLWEPERADDKSHLLFCLL